MVDNYTELGNAVVVQAAEDYREVLVKRKKCIDKIRKLKRELNDINLELSDLEGFFTGEDITFYTELDGKDLMYKLKKQVIEANYDLEAIKQQIESKQQMDT